MKTLAVSHTLARVLGTKEASERREQILDAIGQEAKNKLRRAAGRAADSWLKQLDLVDQGQRGDHRPAKDLLTHLNVVDVPKPVVEEKSRMLIWIGKESGQPPVVVDPQGNRYNPEDFPEHDPFVEVLADGESDEPSEGEPQPDGLDCWEPVLRKRVWRLRLHGEIRCGPWRCWCGPWSRCRLCFVSLTN